MSKCPSRNDLALLLDESLTTERLAIINRHVAECETCQHQLNAMTSAENLLPEGGRTGQQSPSGSLPDLPSAVSPDVQDLDSMISDLKKRRPPAQSAGAFDADTGDWETPPAIGGYEFVRPLGRGGMGAVWLARDPQLDRHVAIKLPFLSVQRDSQVIERFRREARAQAALQHPGICPIHSVGEVDGLPYIAMAWLNGKQLTRYLRSKRRMEIRVAVSMIQRVAVAIAYAHSRGVIHRDLKPSNIMVINHRTPVVMDFGLAKRNWREDEQLTMTGQIVGSPEYMSPEQMSGNPDEAGAGCDIYCLGVILYEALTGQLPFQSRDLIGLIRKIAVESPPRPSSLRPAVDPALDQICLQAMEKDVMLRYQSMQEFADALKGYARGNTVIDDAPPTISIDSSRSGKPGSARIKSDRRSLVATGLWTFGMLLVLSGMLYLSGAFQQMSRDTARTEPNEAETGGDEKDWLPDPEVDREMEDRFGDHPEFEIRAAREETIELFEEHDGDRDGAISRGELIRYFIGDEQDDDEAEEEAELESDEAISEFDIDGDHRLSFEEMVAWVLIEAGDAEDDEDDENED